VADYGKVARLLGQLHNANWQSPGGPFHKAFRGRLQNFQRFGIPLDKNPGRGKKIDYKKDDVFQLAFCLEMAEFGVDPTLIANVMKYYWKDELFEVLVEKAAPGKTKDDVLFCFSANVMSGSWGINADAEKPSLHFWTSSPHLIGQQIRWEKHGYKGRFGVINASELHRKIIQLALALNLGDW
jgi:hypothetical protein